MQEAITREEFERLTRRVELLSEQLNALSQKPRLESAVENHAAAMRRQQLNAEQEQRQLNQVLVNRLGG